MIDGRFRGHVGNHVFFSMSFFAGLALQFGSLERNLYSLQFIPNWTSTTPANLMLTFVFNPRDLLTTTGKK